MINEKLGNECVKFSPVGFSSFSGYPEKPYVVQLYQSDSETLDGNAEEANAKNLALPNALVKAGVWSVKDSEETDSWTKKVTKIKQFSLTNEGRKFLEKPKSPFFCMGHYKVDKIIDFTKPSEAFGMTVSNVRYTYSPVGLPDWTKSEELKIMIEEIKDNHDGRVTLVLKNAGWSTEK